MPAEINGKLRQVKVLTVQGKAIAEAVRAIGVTEPACYYWWSEYSGLKLDLIMHHISAWTTRWRLATRQRPGTACHRQLQWAHPIATTESPGSLPLGRLNSYCPALPAARPSPLPPAWYPGMRRLH